MRMLISLKERVNIFLLLNILLTVVLLQHGTVWGSECRFNSGSGGTTLLANSNYSGGPVRISTAGSSILIFTVNLSPTVTGECGLGNDGMDLWSITDTSVYAGTMYQLASYLTNIPGVVYSVRIQTNNGGNSGGGYFYGNTSDYQISSRMAITDNWDKQKFVAQIELRANDDFRGNINKVTEIHPKAGTLGSMSLGVHTDSNNHAYKFTVDESSFRIPVVMPTCDILMLSNGTNTLDLGDYYISDIKNNATRDIPFSLALNECTSTVRFTTKLTSTKVTGSENLLGNTLTSNAAAGMGVKILHDGVVPLVPNNPDSTYIFYDYSVPGSTNLNFIARLVADGNAFKAGQFKATSVFNVTYE